MQHNYKKFYKLFFTLLFVSLLIFLFNTIINPTSDPTISTNLPLNHSTEYKVDLNGDAEDDFLKIIESNKGYDIEVSMNDDLIKLSSLIDSDFLIDEFTQSNIHIINLSRDSKEEILIQGTKNNNSIVYLFAYINDSFKLMYTNDTNVLYFKDSSGVRTPQLLSFHHYKNTSPHNAFMLVNNELIDITKNSSLIPETNPILSFIDLVCLDYVLEPYPDIFSNDLSKDELSILWKLDKDNFDYDFMNAFIHDTNFDEKGNASSLESILIFQKKNIDNNKVEYISLKISIDLTDDFKITSISQIKR